GPVSRVAYCPDSFGHPAQLPQLFRGFGLGPFIYWRGGGDEVDSLPAAYLWTAPDGSAVLAHRLAEGYFAASGLPLDPAAAPRFRGELLGARTANLLPGVWSARLPLSCGTAAPRRSSRAGRSPGRPSAEPSARPTSGPRCVRPGALSSRTRRTTRSAGARRIA